MTDDPTTTGPEQTEPEQEGQPFSTEAYAAALRGIPGGVVVERSPFLFNWESELVFTSADNKLTIELEVKDKQGNVLARGEVFAATLVSFGTPTELNNFLADVKRNYFNTLRDRLAEEAGLLLRDACRAMYHVHGFGIEDRAGIVKDHMDATGAALETLLASLPEKQREPSWAKVALRSAVWVATSRLIQRGVTGRTLNLDAVNEELRALYPSQAPQSGEALRKQLDERGLSWRTLKAEAERINSAPLSPSMPEPKTGAE